MDLAVDLLDRSECSVQCAAVLADSHGVYSWGQNHVGFDGMGMHAEDFCLRRSNRRRWAGSTLWVAAKRKRNGKTINAKPCEACQKLIRKIPRVMYRDNDGEWKRL